MVFLSKLKIVVCAIFVATSSSAVLRSEPKATIAVQPKTVVPAKKQTTKPRSDAETLEGLSKGLQTIHNLRALFSKENKDSLADGAEKFANGAMSEELSKKDSEVWSTIETMLGATQNAMVSMKGKSEAERKQVMASLEGELNKKASVLSNK